MASKLVTYVPRPMPTLDGGDQLYLQQELAAISGSIKTSNTAIQADEDDIATNTANIATNTANIALKANIASPALTGGVTMSGTLKIGAGAVASTAGDIGVSRTSSPTTGAIFLGNSGGRYLFFDGANYQFGGQSTALGANGYAMLPSGLIIQWGAYAGGGDTTITLPLTFPNGFQSVVATQNDSLTGTQLVSVGCIRVNAAQFVFQARFSISTGGGGVATQGADWIAIGY